MKKIIALLLALTCALALFAAPRYLKSGITTIPQLIGLRFDRSTKLWFSILYIVLALVVQIPVVLYSGSLVFENIFGLSKILGVTKFQSIVILCVAISVIGSIYAIFGGLKAVAVSDTVNGVGLLIGGVIFGITGGKISSDAKKAQKEIEKETQQTEEICNYLLDLQGAANRYGRKLDEVGSMYHEYMEKLKWMVVMQGRADWDWYTEPEKQLVNNTALLVKLLYDMCKVELVQKSEEEDAMNTINTTGLEEQYQKVEQVTESLNANF